MCYEIIRVTNNVSTNVTSAVSLNYDDKKVRYKMDCYILHTFLLVIILIFMIAIICYYYEKHRSKQEKHRHINNIKIENNELKKVGVKNCTCCYFDGIIKTEDFDFDNVLFDIKPHETILNYDVLHKTLIGAKPLPIKFDKVDGFIIDYDGTKYSFYLALKNMMPFSIG